MHVEYNSEDLICIKLAYFFNDLRKSDLGNKYQNFHIFGERASSCFQVIAVTWDVVEEDKMIALQQLPDECWSVFEKRTMLSTEVKKLY